MKINKEIKVNREEIKKLIQDKYKVEIINFYLSSVGFKGDIK